MGYPKNLFFKCSLDGRELKGGMKERNGDAVHVGLDYVAVQQQSLFFKGAMADGDTHMERLGDWDDCH